MLEDSDVGDGNGGNLDEAVMAVSLDAAMACRWGVARRIGVAGGWSREIAVETRKRRGVRRCGEEGTREDAKP